MAFTVKFHSHWNQDADSNIDYDRDNGTWWQEGYANDGDGRRNDHSDAKHYFSSTSSKRAIPLWTLIAQDVGRKADKKVHNSSRNNRQRVYVLHKICIGKACKEKDRKSTRLNSSHVSISYAVFCLKTKRN